MPPSQPSVQVSKHKAGPSNNMQTHTPTRVRAHMHALTRICTHRCPKLEHLSNDQNLIKIISDFMAASQVLMQMFLLLSRFKSNTLYNSN